jgi:hypothetical protein
VALQGLYKPEIGFSISQMSKKERKKQKTAISADVNADYPDKRRVLTEERALS